MLERTHPRVALPNLQHVQRCGGSDVQAEMVVGSKSAQQQLGSSWVCRAVGQKATTTGFPCSSDLLQPKSSTPQLQAALSNFCPDANTFSVSSLAGSSPPPCSVRRVQAETGPRAKPMTGTLTTLWNSVAWA